jgi:hypothetical protein
MELTNLELARLNQSLFAVLAEADTVDWLASSNAAGRFGKA